MIVITRDVFEQALTEYERALKDCDVAFYSAGYEPKYTRADAIALRAALVARATRGAVPREPTQAMIDAAWPMRSASFADQWRAMYDAALAQPSDAGRKPCGCLPDHYCAWCWRGDPPAAPSAEETP